MKTFVTKRKQICLFFILGHINDFEDKTALINFFSTDFLLVYVH